MPIPDFEDGILPPFIGDGSRAVGRYLSTPVEMAGRFGGTRERRQLLVGLLDYRAELRGAGLVRGFQWIDGSFVEEIEQTGNRAPRDIDVVTFFHLPAGQTQETLAAAFPALFRPTEMKRRHAVDAHCVPMDPMKMEELALASAYWESLWSHKRGGQRKGYLLVDLSGGEDEAARRLLLQEGVEA